MMEKKDQNIILLSSHFIKQREYWKEKLSGDITGTSIAPDLPSSGYGKRREQIEIPFSGDLTQRLIKLSKGSDLSIYICIVAVLKLVLQRYTSNSESFILSPINMLKVSRETMNHILFLRGTLHEGSTFKDLLLETRAMVLEAYDNQDYPYEKLVEYLPGILSENFYHISTVACALMNIHDKENTRQIGGNLSFQFERTGEQITGELVYNADGYSNEFVEGISRHFVSILQQAISDVNVKIFDIEMLSQDEKEQLIYGFNNNTENYPKWKTLHGLFEEQVDKTPDNIVLLRLPPETNQSQSITYKKLNEMSNLMASFLKEKGVEFGTIVAIKFEKSIEMIVGILSILKAGAAYLPINPKQPDDRTQYMLKDSSAKILIDETVFEEKNILVGDGAPSPFNTKLGRNSYLESTTIAYVIYTSGSTGKPKGVAITHSNISPLLHWGYRCLELGNNDRTLQNLSYYFDWSVWEIFITLTSGSSLYQIPEEWLINPEMCIPFMEQHNITAFHATPSQYQYLIGSGQKIETLNYLFLGAEKLTLDMAKRSLESVNNKCRIFNMYGPTEATIISAVLELTRPLNPQYDNLSGIPIGKGVGNTHLFVLDNYHSLCPVKVAGELYISGDGISNGYLNNPQLTAEKFLTFGDQKPFYKNVPEPPKIFDNDNIIKSFKGVEGGVLQKAPFAAGSTLYKTGDHVQWLEDGNIEFLERIDFQVKIRGFRIELGEIEAAISANPLVKEAVVIARSKGEGENVLYAYFVSDEDIEVTGMQTFLKNRLPDYMVPSFFTRLEKMPLSQSGKIDRNALPEPRFSTARTYTPPRNILETRLSRIWSEVLGLQQKGETESETLIDIDENFFNLGGHSLKATLLSSRLHKDFGVPVPLAEIFKTPTIRGLAKYIHSKEKETYTAIPVAEKKSVYPLSPAQKRLFFLHQMDEGGTHYNMPQVIPFPGLMDIEQLESAFKQLIRRHESLRTSFEIMENEPVQRIHESVDFEIRYYEESFDIKTFVRNFDLSKAPLLRVAVVHRKDKENILLVDMHHIITDGISQDILKDEFQILYEGKGEELRPLNLQYKDYAQWQNSETRQTAIKEQEMYWLSIYADEVPVINLPTDFPRPFVQSFDGFSVRFSLSPEENDVLRNLAKVNDATQYMSILSIFTILLSKLSGQEDIVIGTPVAARRHTDLENIIGMFVNTLALRNKPFGYKTLNEFVLELKERTLDAFENQEYPFEELVDKLVIGRDMGRNPLFDVMFNLLNSQINPDELKDKPEYKEMEHSPGTSKFDLTLTALDFGTQTLFSIEYCSRLFKPQTIERFISYFKQILHILAVNTNPLLLEIAIITPSEKEQILFEFNSTETQYPNDKTIQELFGQQVQKTPDALALVEERIIRRLTHEEYDHVIQLTYKQLDEESNRIAAILKEKGIACGDIVAIKIERSIKMISGILGILKTGAGYLPINTKNPEDRTQFMLKDSDARFLIDASFFGETAYASSEISLLTADSESYRASDIAYIIYTSGSTGNPKGVPISHSNLSPLLHWGYKHLGLSLYDRTLQNLSYYFDWSVWEIFITLTSGSSLYIFPDEIQMNPDECIPYMQKENITVLHATPSQYQYFIQNGRKLETLKYLFLGAEKLTFDMLLRSLKSINEDCRIFNMYGPTEATIISAVQEIGRGEEKKYENLSSIPIGKGVGNTTLLILDKYLNVCPVNVAGELHIFGDGVAQGYLNNPVLTAEKFVAFGDQESFYKKVTELPKIFDNKNLTESLPYPTHTNTNTFYKTGDFVRWFYDSTTEETYGIEFLGRIDNQVKIRGFRIELGEIENTLLQYSDIKEAVVIARETESGENTLYAYITSDGEFFEPLLLDFLGKHLPYYMIPSYFIPLEKMPLSPTGKIDRKALLEPNYHLRTVYTAPRNEIEEKLTRIWAEVLGKGRSGESPEELPIGIDDNFFLLGGHSLKATVLTSRIYKDFNVKMPLTQVFKTPTIQGMALYIQGAKVEKYASIEPAEEKEFYPLSSAQKRVFILQQMETGSISYNMPQAIPLPGEIHKEKLESAFKKIINRHDSLRTSFEMIGDEPVQRIHEMVDFQIENYEENDEYDEYNNGIKSFVRPFDLSTVPLLRAALRKGKNSGYTLLIDMHHIISDGSSMGILKDEFQLLYSGKRNELTPLRLQYKDYVLWQASPTQQSVIKEQESYWLTLFSGEVPVLNLPTDYPRPLIQSFEGCSVGFLLNEKETAALKLLANRSDITLYMCLLSVFTILLSNLSGQEDIIVGTPVAARRHTDLEKIIGMFVNTLAMRNNPTGEKRVKEYFEVLKKQTLDAYENQEYPFEDMVEKITVGRNTGRNPVFDVMFNLLNFNDFRGKANELYESYKSNETEEQEIYTHTKGTSKFDLMLTAIDLGACVRLSFEYCTKLFKPKTIDRFISYFKTLVNSLLTNSHAMLSELEIIPEPEKRLILYDLNNTEEKYPRNKTVHRLFEEQVEKTPYRIAVSMASQETHRSLQLTYTELNEKSGHVAYMLQERGVTNDSIVAIMIDPSVELVVGIIGILKAGGAYLPIDTNYPEERKKIMLADSNTGILLIRPQLKEKKDINENKELDFVPKGVELIDIDDSKLINGNSGNLPHTPSSSESNLVYVLYTSGSTGRPKGVMLEHRNVVNLIYFGIHHTNIDFSKILFFHSIGFDVSFQEIFYPLISGGQSILIPEEIRMDIPALFRVVEMHQICTLFLPMSFLKIIFGDAHYPALFPRCVKHIQVAGEQVVIDNTLRRFLKENRVYLHNHYGPSETHVVTALTLDPAEDIPQFPTIGKPISNTCIYILNKYEKLRPLGISGEAYFGGMQVGRGYLNRPELTAEKFILHHRELKSGLFPLIDEIESTYLSMGRGSKPPNTSTNTNTYLYKTGDLVRWIPDPAKQGAYVIEFLGRIDNQVKIRGFRIELGEIEARILEDTDIKDTVVVSGEKKSGEKYLCAYFTSDKKVEISNLKRFLAEKLPDYMIPSYFSQLEKMPLNPNGKIDRKRLPVPELKSSKQPVAPNSNQEKIIAEIWMEVLELDQVGIDDNFFEIGGNSLDTVKLSRLLKERFKKDIPVVIVFRYPTIRALAAYIEQEDSDFSESKKDIFEAIDKGKDKLKKRMEKRRRE